MIQESLDRIENMLEQLLQRMPEPCKPRLSPSDYRRLSRLLVAVAGVFGSEPIQTSDILSEPPLAAICADMDASQVGSLLSRGANQDIAGYQIQRQKKSGNAWRWVVLVVKK